MTLVLRDVEVEGQPVDVVVEGDRIEAVSPRGAVRRAAVPGAGAEPAVEVIDGGGGALIPGLHDHHIHLLATAAAIGSVHAGPPEVMSRDELASVLRAASASAPRGAWLRAVGYHESVAGDLGCEALDAMVDDRPLRLQHRSGALWMLNSRGVAAVDPVHDEPGVERDATGAPTGRFWRADAWLRERWDDSAVDLAAVGRALLSYGVTGVTDTTPFDSTGAVEVLASAVREGALQQHVWVTGGPAIAGMATDPLLHRGPVKLVLGDHDLPPLDRVREWVRQAHDLARPVAFHCVTAEALVITLEALRSEGAVDGDRVEHAAVVPGALIDDVRALGARVVTQPGLVTTRGADYLRDVDVSERDDLWRCGSLLRAGIRVAAGSDAPYGPLDPWLAIRAAVDRRTSSGAVLGDGERIDAARALALYLSAPDDPGGAPRTVSVGATADLCLLGAPLAAVLESPSAALVRATVVGGRAMLVG